MTAPVLEVADLRVEFPTDDGVLPAVRGVDLAVRPGQVLGVVGESGSGKSVSMLAVMGLLPRHATVTGSAWLAGRELLGRPPAELRAVRGREVAMVFQDPMTSLNPVFTVGDQVSEALRVHQPEMSRREGRERASDLLRSVGIPAARKRLNDYPHQFSGGMRQRVVIAMAIANDPAVLIADEPTTALDVTVQAQILELLHQLCAERNLAVVLVSHDLGVVSGLADHVTVMYAGRIVERGQVEDVFYRSAHPYTRGLLAAVPRVDQRGGSIRAIPGTPSSLLRLPPGCVFAPRCSWRVGECEAAEPPLRRVGPVESACLRATDVATQPRSAAAGAG